MNKVQFLTLLFWLCVVGFLQSCVSLSIGQSSFPFVEKMAAVRMNKGILELHDLTVSVRPENGRMLLNMVGFIVPFPLLLPGTQARSSDENFRIYIQLETSENGFLLDPTEVKIRVLGKELGPEHFAVLGATTSAWPKYLLGPSDESPGHKWQCARTFFDVERNQWFHVDVGEVPLLKLSGPVSFQGRTCFLLEYSIGTLPPAQDFTIEIGGIKRYGKTIQVPPITFHSKTGIEYALHLVQ